MEGRGWRAALSGGTGWPSSPNLHNLAFGTWCCESGFYTQLARIQHGQNDSLAVLSWA